MLKLTIKGEEHFDDEKNEFLSPVLGVLELEHSLVSLSKWESFWEKPFLGKEEKTDEQALWYVNAMVITPDFDPNLLNYLSVENFDQINKYIDAKMTATWFGDTNSKPSSEVITAEVIYYWMIALNVPPEYQHWHLNRLLTLIKVINAKNQPEEKKKPVTQDQLAERRRLNAERRAQGQSKG